MIRLENVRKTYPARDKRQVVLKNTNATFESGRNIGIMGVNGAGKSTLLRIISGTELPDLGRVVRTSRVSFPLGFGAAIHPNLSGRENVAFVARIYGADPKAVVEYVKSFAELGSYFDMPTRTYSSGMMAKLAFGLSLAIDFEVYLIDEITAVGDARFQARCRAAFEERIRDTSIIMVSHSFDTIRTYCDTGAVLHGGELIIFDNLEGAIFEYRKILGIENYS